MQKKQWRLFAIIITALFLASVMSLQLLRLQLSQPYALDNTGSDDLKTYNYPVSAARGELRDRYGRLLISNETALSLRIDYMQWKRSGQNEVILDLLNCLDERGVTHADMLPVSLTEPEYLISWEIDGGDRNAVNMNAELKKFIAARKYKEKENITCEKLIDNLRSRYDIDKDYDYETARRIIGVRYTMEIKDFSRYTPFVLNDDIDEDLRLYIGAQSSRWQGVRVDYTTKRVYHTKYAAHLLGRSGPIFAEEYEVLKSNGYFLNDTVGKDGAEKAFEDELRGVPGHIAYTVDSNGRIVEMPDASRPPQAGSNVYTTIDLELQTISENALSSYDDRLRNDIDVPDDLGGSAAVVIEIRTGDVLAMASYPTFDITRYNELFDQLIADPSNPLLNRAYATPYDVGSVFKPVVALAALEHGIITPNQIIRDEGRYREFADFQPMCWIYRQYGLTHEDENVTSALRDSCNYFFYKIGSDLGIERLANYAKLFGLGEPTGIELPGEALGRMASPESMRRSQNREWVGGDILQTSIGQGISWFTPAQLASYIATVGNNGTRNELHMMKYVKSSDYSRVETVGLPTIVEKIDIKPQNLKAVMEGMRDVTETGTAASAFVNFPIRVAGKTGSAQTPSGSAHGVFVAFAPYDDPEIAIVILVEHANSGSKISPIAAEIISEYFYRDRSLPGVIKEGGLVK